MKTLLKHIILVMVFLNLPLFGLRTFGATAGAMLSALALVSLGLYYFFIKKSIPILPLLILGILYFSIGGFNYSGEVKEFMKDIFRYFLFIFSITEVAKNTTKKEVLFYLLIGTISVIIHALIFSNAYGRYSGFYLNPNSAGLICIIGFAFTYMLPNRKHKLIAQLFITIAGLATLSRTFILLLVLINIASIFANKKNAIGLIAAAIGFVIILNTPAFKLNSERFGALQSVFSNEDLKTKTITKESRDETWALYTDVILEKLAFGNGYGSMQGQDKDTVGIQVGVHNTYLMILGESGIIPFLFIVVFYTSIFFRSIKQFSTNPEYTYLSLILVINLMGGHTYFSNYIVLFFTVWLFIRLSMKNNENKLENE